MPDQPHIGVMPYKRRQRLFWTLLLIFVVAFPILILYSSGNRIIFSEDETNFVSMGGYYLSSGYDNVNVYLDEEPVRDRRLFRQAFYIQNVPAGIHRLHTQADGLQTWVKELPAYPYIVTEALSFSMPTEPQLRLVSEYLTPDGEAVLESTSTLASLVGTTTNPYIVASSSRSLASTYVENPEYLYLDELFSTSTRPTLSLLDRYQQSLERFTFQSTTATTTVVTATTTVDFQNMELYEDGGEVFARWTGSNRNIPYYFCVRYEGATTTAANYGTHVAEAVETLLASRGEPAAENEWVCREHIRIDRQRQDVKYFNFFPGSADLVLLQLTDGIYVTEVDDRSWQNSQLLYPGTDIEVVVTGGQIFVRQKDLIFEVVPTIQT